MGHAEAKQLELLAVLAVAVLAGSVLLLVLMVCREVLTQVAAVAAGLTLIQAQAALAATAAAVS